MVLNGEEELECEVDVDGVSLEHVSEFKNFVGRMSEREKEEKQSF